MGALRSVVAASLVLTLAACSGAPAVETAAPTAAPPTAPTTGPTASPTSAASATPGASATIAVTAAPTATSATPSPSPQPTMTAVPTVTPTLPPPATPTVAPVVTPTPLPTPGPVVIGPASLDAPDTIAADTVFSVNWVGPNKSGDYVTIIKASKKKWSGEPYFYTYAGTPRQLTSPTTPGDYELRYIDGASKKVKARRPISVTAFVGSLDGPDSVAGGIEFNVVWTGPGTPGDYITIEPVGATEYQHESYFSATQHSNNMLTAPLTAGPHELWYVAADKTVMLREPITVTAVNASVTGPASAAHGATFNVSWTGPNATGDYITIVAVGAPQEAYLSYAYARYGNPVTLTAPATAGQYELRYVYGSSKTVLATAAIQIQ